MAQRLEKVLSTVLCLADGLVLPLAVSSVVITVTMSVRWLVWLLVLLSVLRMVLKRKNVALRLMRRLVVSVLNAVVSV